MIFCAKVTTKKQPSEADTGHNVHPNYRPDIDGLRAVAILSVVLFHAFPTQLRGGFVGVDIFFVISGFLISTIIFRSLQKNDFSFIEFYAHRIKRIFPALIVVLTACYTFGWFALLPDEFKQLGKHMAAGAGFVQNLVLWKEAGYFDTASELKPLMHLWSLAIEEQFYLIYPILIWAAWRGGLNVMTVVILLALISFGLNVSWVEKEAVKTFFVPQTRFWELLAGSVLAYLQFFKRKLIGDWLICWIFHRAIFKHPPVPAKQRTVLLQLTSVFGLLLIILAVLTLHKGKLFPGWWALAPVVGAVLLIASGPNAWVNQKILGSRLMVFVGLISYPLYLWHWPILSFVRIVESEMPAQKIRIAAIAVSFVLAWLTYRFVERPIRFGQNSWVKTAVLVILLAIAGYVGFNAFQRDGLGFRYGKVDPVRSLQIKKIGEAWRFSGYPDPSDLWLDQSTGLKGVGANAERLVLFVGDSHAFQYENSIQSLYEQKRILNSSALFLYPDFPPVIDEKILDDPRITDVVFSFYWSYKYGSETVNQAMRCCGAGKNGVVGRYTLPLRNLEEMEQINSSLESTLGKVVKKGKKAWVILDNPFGEELDARSKLTRTFYGGVSISPLVTLSRTKALERTEPVRSFLIDIANRTGARVVDPFKALCSDAECPMFSDGGDLLYKDYDHLSLFASRRYTNYLLEIFADTSRVQ